MGLKKDKKDKHFNDLLKSLLCKGSKSQEKNIFQLGLPKGLSREELGTRSVRRNPLIADLLHRIALIEKAGTGIRRMIEDARKHKCPEPKFKVNGFFTATFWPNAEVTRKVTGQVGEQVDTKLALSRHQVEILHNCLQEKSLLGGGRNRN